MKLVKWVPALAATLVLAACSTATDASKAADNASLEAQKSQQEPRRKPIHGERTINYTCLNNVKVSATYTFVEGRPKKVDLKIGKKVFKDLPLDSDSTEGIVFQSKKYVWNINRTGAMLTERGKGSDNILAKLCDVVKK